MKDCNEDNVIIHDNENPSNVNEDNRIPTPNEIEQSDMVAKGVERNLLAKKATKKTNQKIPIS